jgi:hypothetical protein
MKTIRIGVSGKVVRKDDCFMYIRTKSGDILETGGMDVRHYKIGDKVKGMATYRSARVEDVSFDVTDLSSKKELESLKEGILNIISLMDLQDATDDSHLVYTKLNRLLTEIGGIV